jgi:hypothetical protein
VYGETGVDESMTDKTKFTVVMSNKEFTQGIIAQIPPQQTFEYEQLAHVGYFNVELLSKFFRTCNTLVEKGGKVEIGLMTRGEGRVCLVARPANTPLLSNVAEGFCMVAPYITTSKYFQKFPDGYVVVKDGDQNPT